MSACNLCSLRTDKPDKAIVACLGLTSTHPRLIHGTVTSRLVLTTQHVLLAQCQSRRAMAHDLGAGPLYRRGHFWGRRVRQDFRVYAPLRAPTLQLARQESRAARGGARACSKTLVGKMIDKSRYREGLACSDTTRPGTRSSRSTGLGSITRHGFWWPYRVTQTVHQALLREAPGQSAGVSREDDRERGLAAVPPTRGAGLRVQVDDGGVPSRAGGRHGQVQGYGRLSGAPPFF